MDLQNEKCVMVIDEHLPLGLIANTAAIMGITLGKKMPEVVGADVSDQSGNTHLGIIEFPVPILKGSPEIIKEIREKLYQPEFQDLTVVDFSDLAQGCKTYEEFIEKMGQVPESSLQYFGIAVCGPKKKVNKLTGSMPLLRYKEKAGVAGSRGTAYSGLLLFSVVLSVRPLFSVLSFVPAPFHHSPSTGQHWLLPSANPASPTVCWSIRDRAFSFLPAAPHTRPGGS